MSLNNKIFKCEKCGAVVEVLNDSKGVPFCCGEKMTELNEQNVEMGNEKHRPIIDGDKIKIGEIPHPMEERHYIEWVEVESEDDSCRKFFKPGGLPEAKFCLKDISKARIYCNIHGLWKS